MASQQPDSTFQALMERIRCRNEQGHKYLAGTSQPRRWMIPPLRGWDGDPFNISDIKKPFDRDAINSEAKDNLTASDGGTTGTGAGKTLQVNYFGMMERAYRIRHMTIVRAHAHAAGRKRAHGDQNGIHTGDTITYIQNILDSGAAGGT
jgi:hypothetical protein